MTSFLVTHEPFHDNSLPLAVFDTVEEASYYARERARVEQWDATFRVWRLPECEQVADFDMPFINRSYKQPVTHG